MAYVADVKNKIVKITLNDGKERTIRFTLNALAELEDKFGSVQAAFDKLEKEKSMKALRTILWAGLLHESPNITEQEVGNLIDLGYMAQLMESIGTALDNDLPKESVVGTTIPNE